MWPIHDTEATRSTGPLWTIGDGVDTRFYLLHVEMPDVRGRDLDVVVERGHLLVNVCGEMVRALPLPGAVDVKHTEASFADGVLTIVLPRAP